MVNPNLGKLVTSKANDLGVGKIVDSNREWAIVEYFDSPISPQRPKVKVPMNTIRTAPAERQTRVYFLETDSGHWRMGRSQGQVDDQVFILLPNNREARIPEAEVFVRWNRPLDDPWQHLTARLTETPYFHSARQELRRHFISQRALTLGLGGLASSPIEMEGYQIEVIRRVLSDSVKRYLLADEVGLGKTIEAGIILRQFALDRQEYGPLRILVIVPEGMESQWCSELRLRCGLEKFRNLTFDIVPFGRVLNAELKSPDFVVVDEAHRAIRGQLFEALRALTDPTRCPNLLLLSATPVLGNEAGFHALLHLLDPVLYPLNDIESFRIRIKKRQELADIFETFRPETPPVFLSSLSEILRSLFPDDLRLLSLLDSLRPYLEDDEEVNGLMLEKSVNLVRSHISEAYRLHRRILRNRRGKHTRNLVTGRKKLTTIPWENSGTGRVEFELERWRIAAVESLLRFDADESRRDELAGVFEVLLDCGWGDVRSLAEACKIRLGERRTDCFSREFGPLLSADKKDLLLSVKLFDEEPDILSAINGIAAEAASIQTDFFNRNLELINALHQNNFPVIVCFATSPALADDFFAMAKTHLSLGVVRHDVADESWLVQWKNRESMVLVCDYSAEEGLNLHGNNACLLHLDFPFSPNRLEQRLGRFDRFGRGKPIHSFSLDRENSPFWSRWKLCLDEAWQVFSRSIASLQYLVDEEIRKLRTEVFTEGKTALDDALVRLSSQEGGIKAELRSIQNQDDLDSVTEGETGSAFKIAESIKNYDDQADAFEKALDYWIVDLLQFHKRIDEVAGPCVVQYEFRDSDRGPQTLIPFKDLARFFRGSLSETSHRNHSRTASTYPLSFSRFVAQRHSTGVARLGNEFVDAVQRQIEWDDRGTSFAMWRKTQIGGDGCVFFRFDFILEGALPEASGPSLRRRIDASFPPVLETVWLSRDLLTPTDDLIPLLDLDYSPEEDGNIRAEHWPMVLSEMQISDWAALCSEVRLSAEETLRGKWEIAERVSKAISDLEELSASTFEQARTRIDGLRGDCLAIQFYLETELAKSSSEFDVLIQGIQQPKFHLDACGAVFLSPKNYREVVGG